MFSGLALAAVIAAALERPVRLNPAAVRAPVPPKVVLFALKLDILICVILGIDRTLCGMVVFRDSCTK